MSRTFYTLAEAAKYSGTSYDTVRRAVKKGELLAVMTTASARGWKVEECDLDAWIDSKKSTGK